MDQAHGFFPHVTRSFTTPVNAIELIKRFNLDDEVKVTYVTRTYATRHGNGPFQDDEYDLLNLRKDIVETNVRHAFQGEFKKSILDVNLLIFSLTLSEVGIQYKHDVGISLTCTDHHQEERFAIKHNSVKYVTADELKDLLESLIQNMK